MFQRNIYGKSALLQRIKFQLVVLFDVLKIELQVTLSAYHASLSFLSILKFEKDGEFSGGPVVRTPHFHCRRHKFNPWWGTKILRASWHGEAKKNNNNKIKFGKDTKLNLIICRFCIYKFNIVYLLKFICNPKIGTRSAFVQTFKSGKNFELCVFAAEIK